MNSENPQSVLVSPGEVSEVLFLVQCEPQTGALRLTTTTRGDDLDINGYVVAIKENGLDVLHQSIGVNASILLEEIETGEYTVELQDVAANCPILEVNPRIVAVSYQETTDVSFTIECRKVDFIYDVGPGVPPSSVQLIQEGLAIAQAFLNEELGGDIPPEIRDTITVKIIATGEGNQEEGGFGSCCTAFAAAGIGPNKVSTIRPFFDVAHEHWLQRPPFEPWTMDDDRRAALVHEYVHGWQHSIGCISQFSQPLGNWMNEGIANWLGFRAMILRGVMEAADVLDFMIRSARVTGQLDVPLVQLEPNSSQPWSGHVGCVAIDMLLSQSSDMLPLRTICQEVADGSSVDEAFETAFGVSKADFYVEAEQWRLTNR